MLTTRSKSLLKLLTKQTKNHQISLLNQKSQERNYNFITSCHHQAAKGFALPLFPLLKICGAKTVKSVKSNFRMAFNRISQLDLMSLWRLYGWQRRVRMKHWFISRKHSVETAFKWSGSVEFKASLANITWISHSFDVLRLPFELGIN